jgi:hypothetical protein
MALSVALTKQRADSGDGVTKTEDIFLRNKYSENRERDRLEIERKRVATRRQLTLDVRKLTGGAIRALSDATENDQ